MHLRGKATTCPASTWHDLTITAAVFTFRFLFFTISLNSFRLAYFRLTLHVGVFPHWCHFLTSSNIALIFAVETAVRTAVCEVVLPQNTDFLFICRQTQFSLHVGGNMTDNSICWIQNILKKNSTQQSSTSPKTHKIYIFHLQLKLEYLKNLIVNKLWSGLSVFTYITVVSKWGWLLCHNLHQTRNCQKKWI